MTRSVGYWRERVPRTHLNKAAEDRAGSPLHAERAARHRSNAPFQKPRAEAKSTRIPFPLDIIIPFALSSARHAERAEPDEQLRIYCGADVDHHRVGCH